jgi:hypothetical protein
MAALGIEWGLRSQLDALDDSSATDDHALLAQSLLEPRVVAYGGKVVVSASVFPEPR